MRSPRYPPGVLRFQASSQSSPRIFSGFSAQVCWQVRLALPLVLRHKLAASTGFD